MADQIVLAGRSLAKGFGTGARRTEVLGGLDVWVAAGSLTLIKGPSGCGKSTLLAMLAGLTRPGGGRVLLGDIDLWALPQRQRDHLRLHQMGFIFQGSVLFPALPVREQVAFLLAEMGIARAEGLARADDALAAVGLANRAHLRPASLSGGEKQRVAIAIALAKAPKLVFADEPTSALDSENAATVGQLLRDQAVQRGTAVLCVTHDDRLLRHADRVLFMRAGLIEDERIIKEVLPCPS